MKKQHLKLFVMAGMVLLLFSCQQESLEGIILEENKGEEVLIEDDEESSRLVPEWTPNANAGSYQTNATSRAPAGNYVWLTDPADTNATTYFDIDYNGEVTERYISNGAVKHSYNTWNEDSNFLFVDDPTRAYNVALPLWNPNGLAGAWYWNWDTSSWVYFRDLRLTTHSLNVSTTSLSFGPGADSKTFSIVSDTDWIINRTQSFISVSQIIGSNNRTITVSVQENTLPIDISGNIIISGGGTSRTITVTQQARGSSGGGGGGGGCRSCSLH